MTAYPLLVRAWLFATLIAGLLGCDQAPIDLTGKRCPCISGWVCDAARMVCVPARDGATSDAAVPMDAPATDGMRVTTPDASSDAGDAEARDAPPANLDAGPACEVLLVRSSTITEHSDDILEARLQDRFGCAVQRVEDMDARAEDAFGMDLILISSTTRSSALGGIFRGTSVPVIEYEPYILTEMGLTGADPGTHFGETAALSEIVITDPMHRLAAGRSGQITFVAMPVTVQWGNPLGDGHVVATTVPTDAGVARPVLFYYRRGEMNGGEPSAGCRVAVPLLNDVARHLDDDGWAIVDAAFEWTLAGCP